MITVSFLNVNIELTNEYSFPGLNDRSWMFCEDYEVGFVDNMPVVQDKLVSIL